LEGKIDEDQMNLPQPQGTPSSKKGKRDKGSPCLTPLLQGKKNSPNCHLF